MRKWIVEKRGNKSQKKVASLCNIAQQTYSAIENGTRRPSPEIAKRIGEVLGFDWTKFYENE